MNQTIYPTLFNTGQVDCVTDKLAFLMNQGILIMTKDYSELQELRIKVRQLERQNEELQKWIDEGEKLINQSASYSVFFRMGHWWADRPWRNRNER